MRDTIKPSKGSIPYHILGISVVGGQGWENSLGSLLTWMVKITEDNI